MVQDSLGQALDRLLAHPVLLRDLRYRRAVNFPQDFDHLFFCEMTLAHDLLFFLEAILSSLNWSEKPGAGHSGYALPPLCPSERRV